MGRAGAKFGFWREVSLALIVFALAIRILVPPGFMVADDAGSLPLVICTGHGPLVIADQGEQHAPAQKTSDSPCAFAGLAITPTLSVMAPLAAPQALVASQVDPIRSADQTPGSGLAAPPPQSHAPPLIPEMA